jgi:hypothetical protein
MKGAWLLCNLNAKLMPVVIGLIVFGSAASPAPAGIGQRFRPLTIFYDVFQRRIKLGLLLLKLKTTCFYLQFTGDAVPLIFTSLLIFTNR